MLKKVLCVGYREWALKIYKDLKKYKSIKIKIIEKKKDLNFTKIKKFNPDLILFYSWSWKIEEKIIFNFKSYMLHPSNLPKFRGGSPIQNQIIRGFKKTKLSLFRIDNTFDGGNILSKKTISLQGNISNIFKEIYLKGKILTIGLLKGAYKEKKQKLKNGSIYKRRKEIESEITPKELKTKTNEYLYNKVRMLTDPYPNAYIKCRNNKKLYITDTKI